MANGKWIYPSDLSEPKMLPCESVYNLVVDKNHIAIVNNTPAILLGHNYTTGILKHEYLGSSKIVDDL